MTTFPMSRTDSTQEGRLSVSSVMKDMDRPILVISELAKSVLTLMRDAQRLLSKTFMKE
jgi:hypothetical protein